MHVMNRMLKIALVVLLAVTLAGCSAIAGIFKAGVWVGVILVVLVLGVVFAIFGRG
jgi:hypothetical protein